MIYYNCGKLSKINSWKENEVYVLTDFDRTITTGNSKSSWSILAHSSLVDPRYTEKRDQLFEIYHPIELDMTLPDEYRFAKMKEWWEKHIQLLVQYQLSKKTIDEITRSADLEFRVGAKEWLLSMHEKGIPVVIISAGVGNLIASFLEQNGVLYDNIFVLSNYLKYENGVVVGTSDLIIHSLNKNVTEIPDIVKQKLEGRNHIIVLGDSIGDLSMVGNTDDQDIFSIGFLEERVTENEEKYRKAFDMVCTEETSFDEIGEYLPIFYKKIPN